MKNKRIVAEEYAVLHRRLVIEEYHVSLRVKTKWGADLESVLRGSKDGKGATARLKKYTKYLVDMVQSALPDGVLIYELDVFGYIRFNMAADTLEQLEDAIEKCNTAVDKWVKKYRIENMKYSGEQ